MASRTQATRSLRGRVSAVMAVLAVVTTAGGVVLMTGATAQATQDIHKSYVCKYVNKPGGGTELLQTGQNPIWVDNHSIATKDVVAVGDKFADKQGYSVVIVANTDKLSPEPSVGDCPTPETPPELVTVTPKIPTALPPSCQSAGSLNVPTQPAGVDVSGGGSDGAGPGTYVFTFSSASSYKFPDGTADPLTVSVTVLPKLTGQKDCPTQTQPKSVTPLYPSATPPSCSAAGTLVVPSQPTGVKATGAGTDGAGPGSYTFTFAPASASFVFPAGTATTKTVTVLPRLTGEQDCPTTPNEQPVVVSPNAPSLVPPTCAAAGSITAPAAQPGVVVAVADLGGGSKRFVSTPASGFVFAGEQSVSTTLTAAPRKTGAACGEVAGTEDHSTGGGNGGGNGAEVEGTSASRGPATVAGTSAAVPNAIDAGLTGERTDVRLLVGQALVGAGLLLFAASLWSGVGLRRRGDVRA